MSSLGSPEAADPRPDHPVYRGAIKHMVYIIKENQTTTRSSGTWAWATAARRCESWASG